MTTTPKTDQQTTDPAVKGAPDRATLPAARAAAPAPAAPPRRSSVARFFVTTFLLVIALGAAFGAGYVVMDREAQGTQEALLEQQTSAQDRIAALEEQILQLQDSRARENSVELDLTDVFAPIKAAVSRLAEAQMDLVAQEISAQVVRIVEADVQNMNVSAGATPLAAIAEAVGAAIEPAVVEIPGPARGVPEGGAIPASEPEPETPNEPGLTPTTSDQPRDDNPAPSDTEQSSPVDEEARLSSPASFDDRPEATLASETLDSRSLVGPAPTVAVTPPIATEPIALVEPRPPFGASLGRSTDTVNLEDQATGVAETRPWIDAPPSALTTSPDGLVGPPRPPRAPTPGADC